MDNELNEVMLGCLSLVHDILKLSQATTSKKGNMAVIRIDSDIDDLKILLERLKKNIDV